MKTIDITCSADAPYLPHASAMLHSLLTHTTRRPLRIWLTHGTPLPEDGRARVEQVASQLGAELHFVPIPPGMADGFSMKMFHPAAWYRILSPLLFPQLTRVLYLDSDIIVVDDIGPLWDTDLGENIFAAAANPLYPFMRNWPRRDLQLNRPTQYLNSGVLLMDLARMRHENLVDRLRSYSQAHPRARLPEQDALSATARDRWLLLHPRWNLQSIYYEYPPRYLPYAEAMVQEALAHPALIHYCGWFKPWQFASRHPLGELYFQHLRQTPWPVSPLKNAGPFFKLVRNLPLAVQYYTLLARGAWRQRLLPRLRGLLRLATT